jgi:glycosyltransferase-like protein
MSERPRIAVLAHSTNPRGGVVHALELGDALSRAGHDVTVLAPDATGKGFFRDTLCHTVSVTASPAGRDVATMVETRIADYLHHFEKPDNRRFDIWHAQDGISANALATLKEQRLIGGFARTVHHVDTFEDAKLAAWQRRAIAAADRLLVVSCLWQDYLAAEFDRKATVVGNGVDTRRYSPAADETDVELRSYLDLSRDVPVFLAVGGIEERKNTLRILQAFIALRAQHPSCRLIIAGGASLLDHSAYQARFNEVLDQSDLPDDAVLRTGPLPQRLMPALYRAATALVFPSTREGFGLVVLEAMASGVPVVGSRIAPLTEYLTSDDVLWCDPYDTASIADAMASSLDPSRRASLSRRGQQLADRYSWAKTAEAHLATYDELRERVDA